MHRIALSLFLVLGTACGGSSGGSNQGGQGGEDTGGSGGSSGSGGSTTGGQGGGGGSTTGGSGGSDTGGDGGGGGVGGGTGGSGVGGIGGGTGGSAGGTGGKGGSNQSDASVPSDTSTADGPPVASGNAFVYAAAGESGGNLTTFSLDLGTGMLTRKGNGTAAGSIPDYLALHPSGKYLYVNNELVGAGRATAMAIGADGTLTMLNSAASGGDGPAAITVHKSGKWLLVANYNNGVLGVVGIGADGKLGTTTSVSAGSEAHYAVDDGVTGNFVFVPCKGDDYVAMYKFDVATGKATPNSPATITVGNGVGPRHIAFNPNGKFAYVSEEQGTALVAFSYDSTTGLLSSPKPLTGLPNDGAHVIVHPSGNFVFHIARGGNTVTVIKVAADGGLSKASSVTPGGYDATITKDGRYLIVVSGTSVKVYSIDQTTGALKAGGSGQALSSSQGVAVITP